MTKPSNLINPEYVNRVRRTSSLSEVAYEAIRDAIVTGRIKPGERMMQVDLANELGVSERTVREAFARLVAKGLAVYEPFKGVRVVALPVEELKEVYTMRAMLEAHAMELAAARISAEDLDRMRDLLPLTAAGEDEPSIATAQETNRTFHWIPIHAAGSPTLERMLEQLWELMFAYNVLYWDPQEIMPRSRNDIAQHTQLVEALAAGDGRRAAEINTKHVHSGLDSLLAWLDREKQATPA